MISVVLHLAPLLWAILLVRKAGEKRLWLVPAVIALAMLRQAISLGSAPGAAVNLWAELPALVLACLFFVVLFFLDRILSEQAESRRSLELALSLHSSTLDATADGILVVDRAGKMVSFNQRFVEMWRLPADVMETRDDDRALSYVLEQLKDPEGFLSKVRQLYSEDEAESHDLIEFKDGRIFERDSRPQKVGGRTVGRVWSFRDVTDQAKVERQLRERAEREALVADLSIHALSGRVLADIVQRVCDALRRGLGADLAEAYRVLDNQREVLRLAVSSEGKPPVPEKRRESQKGTYFGYLLFYGDLVTVEDASRETRFEFPQHLSAQGIRSSAAAVITSQGKPYGLLAVHDKRPRVFDQHDLYFIRSLSHLLSVMVDRRQVEEELRKFKFMVDGAGTECYLVNQKGEIVYCNRAAARSLGYAEEELHHKRFGDVDAAQRNGRFAAYFDRLRREHVGSYKAVHTTRDGRLVPKEMRGAYLKLGDQEYLCLFGRDMTAQMEAEKVLRESETRLQQLLDLSQIAVLLTSEGCVVQVSEAAVALLGAGSEAELLGRPLHDFVHKDDLGVVQAYLEKQASGGMTSAPCAHRIVRLDGRVLSAETRSAATTYKGKPALQLVVSDVTKTAELQQEVESLRSRFGAPKEPYFPVSEESLGKPPLA